MLCAPRFFFPFRSWISNIFECLREGDTTFDGDCVVFLQLAAKA